MRRTILVALLTVGLSTASHAEWTEDAELCATIDGDHARAISHCQAAINSGVLNPEDLSTTWSNLAYEYNEIERFDDAVEAASQAIILDDDNVRGFQNRAVSYRGLKQNLLAVADYKSVLRILQQTSAGETTVGTAPGLGANHGLAEIYRDLDQRSEGLPYARAVFANAPAYDPELMQWYGL